MTASKKEQKETGIDFLKKKRITAAAPASQRPVLDLPLDVIEPDKMQPRQTFHQPDESMVPQAEWQELKNLAQSIKDSGIIQPIVVLRTGEDKYRIVVGERRWRASRMAGMKTIPAVVRNDLSDLDRKLIQLAENIQHENPNDYDTALFIKGMLDSHPELKKSDLAKIINKNNSYVSKMLAFIKPEYDSLTKSGLIKNASVLEQFRNLPQEDQEDLKSAAEKAGQHITATAVQDRKRQMLEKQKASKEKVEPDSEPSDDTYQREPNEVITKEDMRRIHDGGGDEPDIVLPTSVSAISMPFTDDTQQEVHLTVQQLMRVLEHKEALDQGARVTFPISIGAMKEIITLLGGTVPDDPAMISFAFTRIV